MSRKKNGLADLALEPPDEAEVDMAEIVTVAAATLTGDLRDFILDRLRHEQDKMPWHKRSEADQRDTVHQVEAAVREIVTQAVEIIAASGRRTIRATLAKVVVKDGLQAQLELSRFDELRHALTDSVGKRVLVVVADPEEFEGERAPAEITPDQGDLETVTVVHSAPDGVEGPFH